MQVFVYQESIERIAKLKGMSKAKAKAEVVAIHKLESVEALDQFLKRVKRER
jgi:hypothetical protein